MLKSRFRGFIIHVALFALVFVAIEASARVLFAIRSGDAGWLTWNSERWLSFDVDFYPGYKKLAPNAEFGLNVNERGFRGPLFQNEKPNGVFRIVAVGGSSTFGISVLWDEAFPAVLERQLNEQFGRRCVEVINAGIPSQTTAEVQRLVEREVVNWQPDLLVVYSLYNHIFYDRLQFKSGIPGLERGLQGLYDNVAPRSLFVQEVLERLAFNGPFAYENKLESYRATLDSIVQTAKGHGIRVLLANELIRLDAIPGSAENVAQRVGSWATIDQYRPFVAVSDELAAVYGLEVVDFSALSADYAQHGHSLLVPRDSVHLSPKGNQLLATRIQEKVDTFPELAAKCVGSPY